MEQQLWQLLILLYQLRELLWELHWLRCEICAKYLGLI
jgi:hypothetical protein